MVYQRFQLILPTFASRQKFWVARVFFRMAPILDGERARQLANTSWFYDLIDRQLAAETVAQAQRRIVRRKLVNADVRSR